MVNAMNQSSQFFMQSYAILLQVWGEKKQTRTKARTLAVIRKKQLSFFLNVMLSLPMDLLLQEVLSRSKTKIEMFISLLLRQTHLMD